MSILIDQDCTLSDFVTAAAHAHGFRLDQLLPHWPAGQYGMTPVLARAYGFGTPESPLEMFTDRDFWQPLNGDEAFWADMPELPWARELLTLVQSITQDYFCVTSPSWCPSCVPGKQRWWNKFVGKTHCNRLIPTTHKHLMAATFNNGAYGVAVLIDDNEDQIAAFERAGGVGVLLPCHHNRLHEFKADPLSVVRPQLERLRRNK